jgi:uncharacterized membrane protein YsdA (DUF1294 family)
MKPKTKVMNNYQKQSSPYLKFFLVYMVATSIGFILLMSFAQIQNLYAYLLAANISTFVLFAYDKSIAKSDRTRVPEKMLHLFTAAGGSVASTFAMALFRHKTQKGSFLVIHWGIIIVQASIAYLFFKGF